jgi:hypothetical protein
MLRWGVTGIACFVTALASMAAAEDREPWAIFEAGGAGEIGLMKGESSFGPAASVEVTPIENWLEIEAGVSPLFSRGQTEWDTDLIFKKPFDISDRIEFMFGAGPEWVHTTGRGKTRDSVAGEVALDFMFWQSPRKTLGWYLEPSYSYDFAGEHDQSLGVTVGILIPIR